MNKICLMGRLCADVDLKSTTSGISVASFAIAVDRKFKDSNGEKITDFIPIVAWRKTAEFVSKYFKKGQMIAVEGELQTRDYEDRDGNKRKAYEVVADQLYFCGDGEGKKAQAEKPAAPVEMPEISDEDLPF